MAGRDYRGMTAAERLADRRERLIAAAYTLFAELGFHATTIERLCSTARISNRAFYECFTSRDDLLRALYERCVEEAMERVRRAIKSAPPSLHDRLMAGVADYIRFVTIDPRRARIIHLEVCRTGEVLSATRQRAIEGFVELFESASQDVPDPLPQNLHLLALGAIGAINELLVEWVLAEPAPAIDKLIETAGHIFRRTFQP